MDPSQVPEGNKTINIPSHILEAIGKGECTLFFGAGASNLAGSPSGEELSDLITDEFLGGKAWKLKSRSPISLAEDWGLNLASAVSLAYAQPVMFRGRIDTFVKNILSRSKPSPAHLKIPWFLWRAIVTTNYDCLIEDSYKKEERAVQEPLPVLKEESLSQIGARGSEIVPLLKPHGCISQPDSMSLSLEDIYLARQSRRLLFTYIEILHLLGPVIYIGYSFKDIHILDMIYDITKRLGQYRQPILFVTLQSDPEREEKERYWIEGPLKGFYLADGFEQFMDALSRQVTPAILPSMIVGQMAPCRTMTFVSIGQISDVGFYQKDVWEYWLTYSINHPEGYAGVMFQPRHDVDISQYGKVTFELNVPIGPRQHKYLEAKLESTLMQHKFKLNLEEITAGGWQPVSIDVKREVMPEKGLQRLVLADNGQLATLGHEYKIGLRKIKFE